MLCSGQGGFGGFREGCQTATCNSEYYVIPELTEPKPTSSRTVLNISGRSSTWRAEYMAVDDEYPIRVSSHMDL